MAKTENEIAEEVIKKVIAILEKHEKEDDYTRFSMATIQEIKEIKYIHGCL